MGKMKIKDEYRLIHPNQIFSTLLDIFKEYPSDITVEKSLSEEKFYGTIKCVLSPPKNREKVQINTELQGKKKKWKNFEPLGRVWRCELTVNVPHNKHLLEELKDKIFQHTLRGGG